MLLGGYVWGRKAASNGSDLPDRAAFELTPGNSAPVSGGDAPDAGEALAAAQLGAARIAFLDELERRVESEARDPAWSRETEATLARVIPNQLGPAVTIAEARCGTTICRTRLSHPQSARIPDDEFVRFTLNRESLGTMEIQLDTRADGTTTLYFLRRGYVRAR